MYFYQFECLGYFLAQYLSHNSSLFLLFFDFPPTHSILSFSWFPPLKSYIKLLNYSSFILLLSPLLCPLPGQRRALYLFISCVGAAAISAVSSLPRIAGDVGPPCKLKSAWPLHQTKPTQMPLRLSTQPETALASQPPARQLAAIQFWLCKCCIPPCIDACYRKLHVVIGNIIL